MLKVLTPAKINLTLEVLEKRPDGFHEVRSVIQTIKLYDTISLKPAKKLVVECDDDDWIAKESLILRAAGLLKETSGYTAGAVIGLSKKIPLLSGLGGDSSNAAAVLRGLNRLWGLSLAPGELARLASQLGSDTPFFLFGGTALLQGRGEIVSPLPPLSPMWIVLIIPPISRQKGKTGRLYATLTKDYYSNGLKTEQMVSLLTKGDDLTPSNLFNVFESLAGDIFRGLDGYRRLFLKSGATGVHLAGSGPTLFTLVREETKAVKIYNDLKKHGLATLLTETAGSIEPFI
ncbi:MAG: 4-(cytidine 5'-diphospho)-2-C-methyl-D-erythritol kinase [Dehalococcoidia bacterium]|nr:MAG: 4-(cytidine 5'-diphospho)-2-C-methyl-D-erythritol kinase [Dehalococcoidia bacterium]